ncbi:MAG: hypothetical protein J6S67_05985 [Methanobrevibacter sp.]|nr:hypothetical protein [Methanobrevibacter sp.]
MESGIIKIEFTRNPYNITIKHNDEVIKQLHFENAIDFITMLHTLEKKNDLEIYDWAKGYCIFTDEEQN